MQPHTHTYTEMEQRPIYEHRMLERERHYNGKAVASFIFAMAGFVLWLIGPILAVALGHAARNDLRSDPLQKGDGLALAGLIIGWVLLVVQGLALIGAAMMVF